MLQKVAEIGIDGYHLFRNALTGTLAEQICFIHIEKCGGTSLNKAIGRLYQKPWGFINSEVSHLDPPASLAASETDDNGVWDFREKVLKYQLSRSENRYVTGHYQVSEKTLDEFQNKYAFIVLLREPVSKWISHYFFNRYKDSDHEPIELELDEYLETERAHSHGKDYVQLLTGHGDRDALSKLDESIINQAQKNIEKFSVVGFLDEMTQFRDMFSEKFGRSLQIPKKNTSPASKRRRNEELTPKIREKIEKICRPNRRLYDYARSLWLDEEA